MASDGDALRNEEEETLGCSVSLPHRETTLVRQGGATFIGKVTAFYLHLCCNRPALVRLSFKASLLPAAALRGEGAKSSASELPLCLAHVR